MKTFNIIAFCGYKRCGKDFASEHIVKNHNYLHYKFANKLKQIVKVLFDFDDEQIEGNKKETIDSLWGISPRQAMQYIGTDVFQHHMNNLIPDIDRKFWAKTLVNEVKRKNPKNLVISDMRFVHEYEYIKEHLDQYKLTVVKIISNNKHVDTHISENSFNKIPFDHIVINTYDSQFVKDIDVIVKHL